MCIIQEQWFDSESECYEFCGVLLIPLYKWCWIVNEVFFCSSQIFWSMGMDKKTGRGRMLNKDANISNTKKRKILDLGFIWCMIG